MANNPGRQALPAPIPVKRPKRRVTIAVSVALGAGIALGVTLSGSSDSGDSLSVQFKADLTHSIAALAKLGYEKLTGQSPSPGYGTDCASSATKSVRQFLAQHHCKEYEAATFTVVKSGVRTKAVITWVVMPKEALARRYRQLADAYHGGNPPGQPESEFNGSCYASGQNGQTVWAEQIQPTGNRSADQEFLEKMAPSKLPTSYLTVHCAG